jgi:hypothetical protein
LGSVARFVARPLRDAAADDHPARDRAAGEVGAVLEQLVRALIDADAQSDLNVG